VQQRLVKAIAIPTRYVQYFNWHFKRTGTLLEGRYEKTVS
jgi:hypothetical protein